MFGKCLKRGFTATFCNPLENPHFDQRGKEYGGRQDSSFSNILRIRPYVGSQESARVEKQSYKDIDANLRDAGFLHFLVSMADTSVKNVQNSYLSQISAVNSIYSLRYL